MGSDPGPPHGRSMSRPRGGRHAAPDLRDIDPTETLPPVTAAPSVAATATAAAAPPEPVVALPEPAPVALPEPAPSVLPAALPEPAAPVVPAPEGPERLDGTAGSDALPASRPRPATTLTPPVGSAPAWWTLPPDEVPPHGPTPSEPSPTAGAGYADRLPPPSPAGTPNPTRVAPDPADPVVVGPAFRNPGPMGAADGAVRTRRSIQARLAAQGRRRAAVILAVVGGGPLLAALATVALLPHLPGASQQAIAPSRASTSAASRSRAEPVVTASGPATQAGFAGDLTRMAAADAAAYLGQAGAEPDGEVTDAWAWTDTNGRSLVAMTRAVTDRSDDGSPIEVTLRVTYVAGLDSEPTVLRRVRDPKLRCGDDRAIEADFTSQALSVRDLDGDGRAEVTVGWTAGCAGNEAAGRVRLAVMSGTDLFVLRGGNSPRDGGGDAGSERRPEPEPAPAAGQWPPAFLEAARTTFQALYA